MSELADSLRQLNHRLVMGEPLSTADKAAPVIAADRIEELEAIVARLPKTADGVPVVPGVFVYAEASWLGKHGEIVEFLWEPKTVHAWNEGTPVASWRVKIENAYSTREAAERAKALAELTRLDQELGFQ